MAPVTPARRRAAAVLRAVSRGRRLDLALSDAAKDLPSQDRRWLQELAYGTIRLRGRLDHLLDLHLKRGVKSVAAPVLDLLRLGAYQLLYMDGVPAYAAISQAVDQAREEMGRGGGRLANAVLRSLDREGGDEARFPDFASHPLDHLTTWGSHPSWLVERWLRKWGPEETRSLVAWNNTPPQLYLHPLGMTPEKAVALLREGGWDCGPVEEGNPCVLMANGTNPATLLEGITGIIQDPGAALVTVYADPPPGVRLVDLCAAPGGKALALSHGRGRILAGDRSPSRLEVLRENFRRVGTGVDLVVADARRPPLRTAEFVLLDVPCSGTGTFRRHPDARWRLTPEAIDVLVELQAEILEAAWPLVPPGGHLVYSTCTLEEEENEARIRGFLEEHPMFGPEGTGQVPDRFLTREGFLRVLPQDSGFDGSFAARLVRRS